MKLTSVRSLSLTMNSLPIRLPSRSKRWASIMLKKLMPWPSVAQAMVKSPWASMPTDGSTCGLAVVVFTWNWPPSGTTLWMYVSGVPSGVPLEPPPMSASNATFLVTFTVALAVRPPLTLTALVMLLSAPPQEISSR